MNEDFKAPVTTRDETDPMTIGMSAQYRLFEAFIALREKNERQHKLFEQTLNRTRETLQGNFNTFAAETQKAYQQLRQEVVGEKKFSLTLLNELLDLTIEMEHITSARPPITTGAEHDAWQRWTEAIEVQNRKLKDAMAQYGIHLYDAVIGEAYNPALHERVGSKRVDGMNALHVAEQRERGYASQQPGFILRRPKVIVTE